MGQIVKPEKKDRILEAATQEFVERGFKRASIEDIAERAGVGKGTVYLACDSKAELFYQCVHRDLQAWSAQIARYVDPRMSASEILEKMSETGVKYLADHPLVRDLFTGIHAGALPDWRERFAELRTMGRHTVAEVIRMGIGKGEFREDLDVDEIATILQDIQHTGYINYGEAWAKDTSLARRRLDAVFDLVLSGMQVRS